ncbi:MAG: glycoside hydrolase family 88 protein [Arcicella sp.]|jgi:unsaturated rhamnogalacturonyl hydrolase|nr:glycoside hydrolase family 88 protein [Arcicella sp.]
MNVRKSLLFLLILASSSLFAQRNYAEKMAETIMKTYQDSMVVMKYTSHLEQDKQIPAGMTAEQAQKNRPANWNYEMGVVLEGFERLWRTSGDVRYLEYTRKIINKFILPDGNIKTFKMDEYNLDNIPTGRQLLTLYQTFNDKKYKLAADLLYKQLGVQPRNKVGGFWHKLKYPTQMWLDGLYMAEPFYAEYSLLTGKNENFEDIANQFVWMERYARDEKTGLLYHGWDESRQQKWANPQTGKSPEFWSRAMGWYIMGLVDVLDYFPKDHPRRPELLAILNRTAAGIVKYQDPTSGVWWQVTDKGGQAGNYLESSGSSMFIYGLAKSLRMGYIGDSYFAAIKKGQEGLIKTFIETDAQGNVHLTKAVGGAGLGGTPYRDGTYDYYVKEPTRTDDLKASGPFIEACIEAELLNNISVGKGKTVMLDNYFNNEYRKDNGLKYHYTWEDRFDSGFAWFGSIFNDFGANTATLTVAPTTQNLKNASVYIIVDPDTKKETASPNYMTAKDVQEISNWVQAGGTLIMMANDTSNCEIPKFNQLAKAFGVEFTAKNRNMVQGVQFEQGRLDIPANHLIFKNTKSIYVKELATLALKAPAQSVLTDKGDVIMAIANFGKGRIFAIGDPWLYNEYVNAHKLPMSFENFNAAKDLARWSLQK